MVSTLALWLLFVGYLVLAAFMGGEHLLRRTESAKTFRAGNFDKRSAVLVGAEFGTGLLLPLALDFGLFLFPIGLFEGIGALAIMLAGLGFGVWAAATLGSYSRTLLVATDQKVVSSGPCARIRHPGYLGGILLWSGFGVLSSNLVIALLFLIMFVAIYLYRISVEGRMLSQEFGGDYAKCRQRARKRVPLLY